MNDTPDHTMNARSTRALRLRAVRADDVDVQRRQRAAKLRDPVATHRILAVHPEDAVLVAVQGNRLAMGLQITACRTEVVERRLRSDATEKHQPARRVVYKGQQRA